MEALIGIIVGLGLAASCGFRVFVPMLVMSIAAKAGHLHLSEGWSWIGSWPALVCFAVATVVEIGGYCIPWIDNLLDTLASPAAVIAGTIAAAACVSDISPWLKWATAIIAGGGAAAAVQSLTVAVRGTSTATTGGISNPIVAMIELALSAFFSIIAVIAPILAIVMLCVVAFFVVRRFRRRKVKAIA